MEKIENRGNTEKSGQEWAEVGKGSSFEENVARQEELNRSAWEALAEANGVGIETESEVERSSEAEEPVVEASETRQSVAEMPEADKIEMQIREELASPEWQEPEVKIIMPSDEKRFDHREKLVYPISSDRRAVVDREKAVWSFLSQALKSETADDFRAANILAQAIENDKYTDPEGLEQIKEFKESPAYRIKKAGFGLEMAEKGKKQDLEALEIAEERYKNLRGQNFFKRLAKRNKIKEAKRRVEWTKGRIKQREEDIARNKRELDELMAA